MSAEKQRLHIEITGDSPAELGRSRGEQLRGTLPLAYDRYAELFRAVGVSAEQEREVASRALDVLSGWRPGAVQELEALAAAAGVDVLQVTALNARTEVLSSGGAARECSTVAALVGGKRLAVQTWDWHVELEDFWHTQAVAGPGHRFVGVTEQGIVSKIGTNSAGLTLHFNILGHAQDGPGGVPMHVLSEVVLAECGSVDEALALIREAPIASSSAFTLVDASRAVSAELSPVGVFEIPEAGGAVVRTNHFRDAAPAAGQKSELYEPDSSARLELVDRRLESGLPADAEALVGLLTSGDGQPPLCAVPDMALQFGERWKTLCTVVSDPAERTIRVLDGMPTEAAAKPWRVLTA
ncbi:hypothetical protein JD276_10705 [Leucobacter sp. CSA1]|uniref:Peptidase C45 hydrolase domain-containing protein n=1 Tax=Leucobacter chromiisoli TaxID=2796471 RepID=A0A934Q8N1_9MICO|nr:C45 family peptidase [Leucobacter chromiisoli]MBK0419503.1 hypothetical protein [Leucobacter chromiisoli]